ncbi:30S ribosomal protein S20 [Candidatus Gottesmanbacteria bacterium]|nr:30S ribosomal protein S20 [Candidatus Gottesmanbacteria bacterium]
MPIIQSARKKLRQDKKRYRINQHEKKRLKDLLKVAREHTTEKNIREAMSAIDQAAKKHVIHQNKAARLKSRLVTKLTPKRKRETSAVKSNQQKTVVTGA